MATLKERKAFNRAGSMYTVKASFRTLFPDEAMADQVRSAVDLVQPILMEGSLLANLHILRCFEKADSIAGLSEVSQTFYNRYYIYCHLLLWLVIWASGVVLFVTLALQSLWWCAAFRTKTAVVVCTTNIRGGFTIPVTRPLRACTML